MTNADKRALVLAPAATLDADEAVVGALALLDDGVRDAEGRVAGGGEGGAV